MSVETVKQFVKKAETTPAIQKQLEAVPKGGGQWTIAEVVKIGAKAGFNFTAPGLREYRQSNTG